MKHSGCPAGWFLALRTVQLVLAFGVLGLVSYFSAIGRLDLEYYYGIFRRSDLSYTIALGVMTIFWVFISFVLYCINKLLPLAVVIIDAVMLVGWISAVARYLVLAAGSLFVSCTFGYDYDYDYGYGYGYDQYGYAYDHYRNYSAESIQCKLWKALFWVMVLELVTFIPTIVLGSVAFWKLRKVASTTEAGAGQVLTSGKGEAPGNSNSNNNAQVPQWVLYNPATPPVLVPYYPPPQQPLELPRPAYDPTGVRVTSPPPQQQYYMNTTPTQPQQFFIDTRFQSLAPEERSASPTQPQQYFIDTRFQSLTPEERSMSPTYQYPSRPQ